MGCVMMVGIVVNNAILIMDQFNVHVAEGMPRHGAMVTAACERFRPIVMTTVAAVLGMLPLALGRGIGAEMRNGVGVVPVGGILISGVLTLLVMPILYDLFTRKGGAGALRAAASSGEGRGCSSRVTATGVAGVVAALQGTVTQTERLLSMAEAGFKHGVKTRLEVDDAQLNRTRAHSNLARGHRDYLVARATLDWVMGVLGEGPH